MTFEEKWIEHFKLVEDYYKEYGNIDIKAKYVTKEGIKLGQWLNNQRRAYNGSKMYRITEEQINLLNKYNIKWDPTEDIWNEYYNLLCQYKEQNNNTNLSQNYMINDKNLGKWVNAQRLAYNGRSVPNKLSERRIKLLNEIDFDWSPRNTTFLNKKIDEDIVDKYNDIMLDRVKHILTDLSFEMKEEIKTKEEVKEIEKIIVKRIWR